MAGFNPRVSIIIPVYNGSNYLGEAIESALAQSYRNIEVIVVNDGSRDSGETERVALSYGERIRYLHQENGGVSTALNRGIREMTGEYFSWLSHDDLYYPDKVRVQVEWLAHNPGHYILFSDYDFIDLDGMPLGVQRLKHTEPGAVFYALIMEGAINGCTVLIPKTCLEDTGGFREDLRTTQDFDLWFRLARKYPFRHLNQALIKSRVHPQQGSLTLSQHFEEQNELYINALRDLPSAAAQLDLKGTLASFYVKAAIRFTSMSCTKAADFAIQGFRGSLLKDGPLLITKNLVRYAVFRLVSRLYRNEVWKKKVKSINRFIKNKTALLRK
jgi:hypothetical protein